MDKRRTIVAFNTAAAAAASAAAAHLSGVVAAADFAADLTAATVDPAPAATAADLAAVVSAAAAASLANYLAAVLSDLSCPVDVISPQPLPISPPPPIKCAGEFAPVLAVPGLTPAEEDTSNQAPPNHIPFLPPPPLSQADPVTIIPPGCHRLSHCFSCEGFRRGWRPGPRAPHLPLASLARRLKHGHWPRREAFETRKRRFRRLRRRSGARLARSREPRGVPRRRREVRVPQRRREGRVCASLRLRHLCVGRREQSNGSAEHRIQ